MEKIHLDLLKKNHEYLVKEIIINDLFVSLLNRENLLSQYSIEEIMIQKTTSEKNRKFLEILKKRGPNAFKLFISALEISGQERIMYMLMNQTCTDSSLDLKQDDLPKMRQLTFEHFVKFSKDQLIEFIPFNGGTIPLDCYPVTSIDDYIGYAIVINFKHYPNSVRHGSDIDCSNLKELFNKMKIKNEIYDSVTSFQEFLKILQNQAKFIKLNSNKYSFYIFCIMGHGINGCIVSPDKENIELQHIHDIFHDDSNNFSEIPKIFIIHASQAQEYLFESSKELPDENINIKLNQNSTAFIDSSLFGVESYSSDVFNDIVKLSHICNPVNSSDLKNSYNQAFLMASIPGGRAYIGENGSIFIKTLVFLISRYSHSEDLLSMMNTITRIIKDFKDEEGKTILCPFFCSTLTKKLFLSAFS